MHFILWPGKGLVHCPVSMFVPIVLHTSVRRGNRRPGSVTCPQHETQIVHETKLKFIVVIYDQINYDGTNAAST